MNWHLEGEDDDSSGVSDEESEAGSNLVRTVHEGVWGLGWSFKSITASSYLGAERTLPEDSIVDIPLVGKTYSAQRQVSTVIVNN